MKAPLRPTLPPCGCGMPDDLTGTRTHRRWHREWQAHQAAIPSDEARAREWVEHQVRHEWKTS